jgi:asparagine synthase (glutamine-hydrolysing)
VDLLGAAVEKASDAPACGAFLSGGTDSSTVSGTLGRLRGTPARTFSIGFDVPGFDETEYARIAARHFGTEHHEYYVTPNDVVESLPKIAASFDQPFGNASAVPTYHCARFAQESGIARLLAGDGGDELFGWQRALRQAASARPVSAPAGVRCDGSRSSRCCSRLLVRARCRSCARCAATSSRRGRRCRCRYESYNLLQHFGIENVFTPGYLGSVDTGHPLALLADAHAPFAGASLINQMLAIDLRFILADGDLPKVAHMCNLAEIDVTFPCSTTVSSSSRATCRTT